MGTQFTTTENQSLDFDSFYDELWKIYVESVYFITLTVTTVGYGV